MKQIILSIIGVVLVSVNFLTGEHSKGFDHFISAKGDRLYDGDQPFRFVSFNIPNLLTVEDNMSFRKTNAWRLPDAFEIEDALKTIKLVGGKVARTYVITVKRESDKPEIMKYVEGPGKFNERAFRTLDSILVAANKYGVRLMIPFVDNWKWMGGKPQYAAFRGKEEKAFWTDPQIKEDFKQTITFILNRVNTVSGVAYKDEKAILAWELGNELRDAPMAWIAEMAAYVKSIDKNHLVNDGIQVSHIPDELLLMTDVDILSTHHYENNPDDMLKHIGESAEKAKGKKPYYVGEYGFISTAGIREALELVKNEETISGALIWSLRFHNRDGGFYWHSEPLGDGLYKAYHWPGFQSGSFYDEKNVLTLLGEYAGSINEKEVPLTLKPDAPRLLPVNDVSAISWQGSAGAEFYQVERACSEQGPWKTVGKRICDASVAYAPLFNDYSAEIGKSYYYRIIAVNDAGQSEASNISGPVAVKYKTLVDELRNVAVLYHYAGPVSIESRSARTYKEDFHRLRCEKGTAVTYYAPGSINRVSIFAYSPDDKSDLELFISEDGKNFEQLKASVENFFSGELDYGYAWPFLYSATLAAKNKHYLKIQFRDESQLGRVEVRYGR